MNDAEARARLSLEGLSVGDAVGEQLLHAGPHNRARMLDHRVVPENRQFRWTDDTAMALSIVDVLTANDGIDGEQLAQAFAGRYHADPSRGYGRGAHQVLDAIYTGLPYDAAARILFDGQGSMGNGGGMRSAPIGAYFCTDLVATVEHARRSAAPTHAHAEGIAGAIAVAVAAAPVFAGERDPSSLIAAVVEHTPRGPTRSGLERAMRLLGVEPLTAAAELGNGSSVTSSDTIPFAIWCAATHLTDYAAALWACGDVGGDIDTTCAMVGGIIVGAVGEDGIPAAWRAAREPLHQVETTS